MPDFHPISASLERQPKYEIHIRLNSEMVSYRLATALLDHLSYFPAYIDEGNVRWLILTRHGPDERTMRDFYSRTIGYLKLQKVVCDTKFETKQLYMHNVELHELAPGVVGIE